tara:strand:+ start:4020 stop:5108 length:1089 start_codon:yes stop_codon:yes gene_type:complete
MEKYSKMTLPDLAAVVRQRLEAPMPFLNETEAEVARRLGMPIVRQLTRQDSAPGGYKALRMSNLGSCARSLAYRVLGVPEDGRRHDGRTKATFAMGDTAESLLLSALTDGMAAGLGPDGWQVGGLRQDTGQQRVTLHVPVRGLRYRVPVDGHPDGVLKHAGKRVALIEIKSTSSYGYSKAEESQGWGPEESYWWQAQGYMHAAEVDWMGVLLLCKDSGAFTSFWVPRSAKYLSMLGDHLWRVLDEDHTGDGPDRDGRAMPARVLADGTRLEPKAVELYKRKGKWGEAGTPKRGSGALPWQCCYCSHWRPCWGDTVVSRVGEDWRGRPSMKLYHVASMSDADRAAPEPETATTATPDTGDLPL